MTHKRSAAPKKKKGGLLIGMRSGVRKAAKAATHEPSAATSKRIWNIVTVVLIAVAAVFLARRFGWIHF